MFHGSIPGALAGARGNQKKARASLSRPMSKKKCWPPPGSAMVLLSRNPITPQ